MNLKTAASLVLKKFVLNERTIDMDYADYVKIQKRGEGREFYFARLQMISSLVFVLKKMEEYDFLKYDSKIQLSFLDVGSRDGYALEFMKGFGFSKLTGIDLTEQYVKFAQKMKRNVLQGDIHAIPFKKNEFDLVFCRHTLEHSLWPGKALKEMHRVTKPGGYIFVNFPTELIPSKKHTCSIPNIRVLRKLILKNMPGCTIKSSGDSIKVGIIPEGYEIYALVQKKK